MCKFLEIAFAALLIVSGQAALAQEFPTRPVRITSPYPSGSGPDIAVRLIGEERSKIWKQPVVLEAKPGGDGVVAINAVKPKPRDGYELLILSNGHLSINPNIKADLSYDAEKDFAPVGLIYNVPYFVAVSPQSPWQKMSDLIAAPRKAPGRCLMGAPM
jgi:tripartite-type tricarboxylate transporter receptor subunit TctC